MVRRWWLFNKDEIQSFQIIFLVKTGFHALTHPFCLTGVVLFFMLRFVKKVNRTNVKNLIDFVSLNCRLKLIFLKGNAFFIYFTFVGTQHFFRLTATLEKSYSLYFSTFFILMIQIEVNISGKYSIQFEFRKALGIRTYSQMWAKDVRLRLNVIFELTNVLLFIHGWIIIL